MAQRCKYRVVRVFQSPRNPDVKAAVWTVHLGRAKALVQAKAAVRVMHKRGCKVKLRVARR